MKMCSPKNDKHLLVLFAHKGALSLDMIMQKSNFDVHTIVIHSWIEIFEMIPYRTIKLGCYGSRALDDPTDLKHYRLY